MVGDQERRLSLEVEYLQRSLIRTQQELDEARTALKEATQIKEEKIRLETRLDAEQKRIEDKERQIQELKGELGSAQHRIEELTARKRPTVRQGADGRPGAARRLA